MSSKDHYSILGLSAPHHTQYDSHAIKAAYRRALLVHHPDKAPSTRRPISEPSLDTSVPTIDDISLAYKILSDAHSRAEYDRTLLLRSRNNLRKEGKENFHSGLDTVDLDDLEYDEAKSIWARACRCGQERGFVIMEQELEREAETGEVYTGCRGCSLWLRVLFEVDGEDGQTKQGDADENPNG